MKQYEEDLWMMDYLEELGIDYITIGEAIDDRTRDYNYKLLKENPNITKAEFLEKMKRPPME